METASYMRYILIGNRKILVEQPDVDKYRSVTEDIAVKQSVEGIRTEECVLAITNDGLFIGSSGGVGTHITPSEFAEAASGISASHSVVGHAYITRMPSVKSGVSTHHSVKGISAATKLGEAGSGIVSTHETKGKATHSRLTKASDGIVTESRDEAFYTAEPKFAESRSGIGVAESIETKTIEVVLSQTQSGIAISQINSTTQETKTDAVFTLMAPGQFSIKIRNNKKNWDGVLKYSTDKVVWHEWDGTTTITSEDKAISSLHFRGIGNTHMTDKDDNQSGFEIVSAPVDGYFVMPNGKLDALLDYRTVTNGNTPTRADFAFRYLFAWDHFRPVYRTFELSTNLTTSCYSGLFYRSHIIQAPILPATTLANGCSSEMFNGCVDLESLPLLPAKVLKPSCYLWMFEGCTKIKLSATQTGEYQNAYRIPSSGTGTDASAALTWMFQGTGGTIGHNPDYGTLNINQTYYTSNSIIS